MVCLAFRQPTRSPYCRSMSSLARRVGVGLLLCSGWLACDQIIDIDIPEAPPRLVVSATASETGDSIEQVRVFVSQATDVYSDDDTAVESATAVLLRNGMELDRYELQAGSIVPYAVLRADLTPGPDLYELRVTSPGYPTASATQRVPSRVPLQGAVLTLDGGVNAGGYRLDRMDLTFTDPPTPGDYYLLRVYHVTQLTPSFYHPNPSYVEPYGLWVEWGATDKHLVLSDADCNGQTVTVTALGAFGDEGGEYHVAALHHIDEDRYRYERSLHEYFRADPNPFSEPALVHSNITGGYGIFSITTVDTVRVEY